MLKWKSIYGFWKKGAVKSHSSNFKYPLQLFSCGEGLFFRVKQWFSPTLLTHESVPKVEMSQSSINLIQMRTKFGCKMVRYYYDLNTYGIILRMYMHELVSIP